MITIEYTTQVIENEPGPNFYWRGQPHDYLMLINDLHRLGTESDVEIDMNDIEYVEVLGKYKIIARSSDDGRILCHVNGDLILIDLSNPIWRQILGLFLRISFYPSHEYVEFDNLELIEGANFIVSSEG
jgi:hypothetical protein